jgi:fructoselysine-6-P-deglycase FrlB-like protein
VSILWDEACEIPSTLAATLDRRDGFDAVLEHLVDPAVRRIVVTGNGAAYYAAMALGLAAMWRPGTAPVIALPAGIVADRRFSWVKGDLLVAISSSGEFRDVVEVARIASRSVAITAAPASALAKAASASALIQVHGRRAITHTQAYCGSVIAALSLWSEVTGDADLRRGLSESPSIVARGLASAESWAAAVTETLDPPRAAIAFGTGPAWAAALEASLLLKEVAGVPAEGVETREGATSAMYGLGLGHLVLSIETLDDPLATEAEEVCALTGAAVIRVPGGDLGDPRLAPISSFPAALALAIGLAKQAGRDVDSPSWADAYARTSRPEDDHEQIAP